MQFIARGYQGCAAAIAVLVLLTLSACREDEVLTLPAASDQTVEMERVSGDWLEANDDETPLAFLTRVTDTPPDRIAAPLDRAAANYGDSPRMIANRSAQLWHEIRQKDDPSVPIETLLDELAARGDLVDRSIGPVIQHYRVLRAQGAGHQAAMKAATTIVRAP